MNSQQLSRRLATVADLICQYGASDIRLADIGSDHAYLPCHLALNQKIQAAVAGEVVKGPYQSAQAEVQSQGLDSIIQVRLGDIFAECVVLKPIGYPFDFALMENDIEISNTKLFEELPGNKNNSSCYP